MLGGQVGGGGPKLIGQKGQLVRVSATFVGLLHLPAFPMAEPTATPDVRLLRAITLRNILSFGPDTPPLKLRALNVLIGPNGSGKSNLLDAVELLKKAPDAESLRVALRADDWIYKRAQSNTASLKLEISFGLIADVSHQIELRETSPVGHWHIAEDIETIDSLEELKEPIVEFKTGNPFGTFVRKGEALERVPIREHNFFASCLFQYRGTKDYFILTSLATTRTATCLASGGRRTCRRARW